MAKSKKRNPLALKVAALRASKGLSLRAVAEAGGISHVSVFDIEEGHVASPGLDTLQGLAKGLGVELFDLLPSSSSSAA